ncbi:retrovirus-related pol polyprotein from transposon TNT 1-94 [Tanacetum coccineum]
MSTPVNTSSTDSQMHNNIMAAGSKDRPPMLGPGRYSQWRSRFLRYIDTKPNGEGLRKSILSGPYVPSTVLVQVVAATEGNPAIQQHTTIETVLNMTPENKEHFLSEKEAIFLLLTGIGDEIYSTVDTCNKANEMWIAIERLQQGKSLNVKDVKTNLFWEYGKFTSRDGESMESYYLRFYKLMNELTRNNLQVTTMQVNVQFLQQLQPEWSRFVTVVKQSKEIDTISYHILFDILKQYQNEVNDIRAERIAKSDITHFLTFRSSIKMKHDPEQAQKDTGNAKEFGTPAKYFQKPLQPTRTTNFRTSQTPGTRLKIPHQVGSQVVQHTGIQCFNCKGYGHYAKECRKPKRVKDYAYHKEKMMISANKLNKCSSASRSNSTVQGSKGSIIGGIVSEKEIDKKELEAHYGFMAKIQEVLPAESNERDALANLIANLTLDTEENKTILKQLKKANASLTQELEKCKTNLDETNSALGEAISCRDSCLIALQNKQNEFEKYNITPCVLESLTTSANPQCTFCNVRVHFKS